MSSQYTYPDYGVSPGQLPAIDPDAAEQSARLGYPSWRRSGKVLLLKNFTTNLAPYYKQPSGTAEIVYNEGMLGSCLEIKLLSSIQHGGIYAKLPSFPKKSIGFETFFMAGGLIEDQGKLEFEIFAISGGIANNISFLVDIPTMKISFLAQDSSYHELAQLQIETNQWHNLKFTADLENQQYTNLWIDTQNWHLDEPLPTQPNNRNVLGQYINVLGSSTGNEQIIFLQSTITTMDEPQ